MTPKPVLRRPGSMPRMRVATLVEAAGAPPLSVPLDYLTVMPATLDAGVRALSGGRCHVDFTALDL